MSGEPDLDAACPVCNKPVGEHTVREWSGAGCLAGMDYVLPYQEVPDGPLKFPGTDGDMAGEVTIMAATLDSAVGRFPVLRFIFTGPGPMPMSRRSLPPINLVMDANGLRSVRHLFATAVDKAILAARRGR